jgi:hypothetical protein
VEPLRDAVGPAREAILAYPASDGLAMMLENPAKRGAMEAALLTDFRHVTDPRTARDPHNASLADSPNRWSRTPPGAKP